jgi:hypothetical protein
VLSLDLLDLVDAGDVGVTERGQHLRLALEARQPLGVLCEGLWQYLDRHLPPELGVFAQVHLSHAAFT